MRSMPTTTNVLVALHENERGRIADALAPAPFTLLYADCCEEAREMLRLRDDIDAVIMDVTLCDGNWLSIHVQMVEQANPAGLIVMLPQEGLNSAEIEAHGVFGVIEAGALDEQIRALVESAAAKRRGAVEAAHV